MIQKVERGQLRVLAPSKSRRTVVPLGPLMAAFVISKFPDRSGK